MYYFDISLWYWYFKLFDSSIPVHSLLYLTRELCALVFSFTRTRFDRPNMLALALSAELNGWWTQAWRGPLLMTSRVTDLKPTDSADAPYYFTFKVQCTSCRETHPNWISVSRHVSSDSWVSLQLSCHLHRQYICYAWRQEAKSIQSGVDQHFRRPTIFPVVGVKRTLSGAVRIARSVVTWFEDYSKTKKYSENRVQQLHLHRQHTKQHLQQSRRTSFR